MEKATILEEALKLAENFLKGNEIRIEVKSKDKTEKITITNIQSDKNQVFITCEDISKTSVERNTDKSDKEKKLLQEVTKIMHELGVPSQLKGYLYLRDAIMMELEDDEEVKHKITFLYEQIAKKYNANLSSVERLMRSAIERAWTRGSIRKSEELFGYTIDLDTGRPTNSQFISTIVDSIRLNHLK